MSTVAPADFATLARGKRVVLCALIAGYEHPIVPSGISLTDVTWTSGADGAWHTGTSGIVSKPWYDLSKDAPPLVITERVSPVQGELEISSVILPLTDPNTSARAGEVSTLIANRSSMTAAALALTLTAAGTTATLETTSGFGTTGNGYIGRESISWTGKTSTTLTGLSRGLYGSRARVHAVVSNQVRPVVYADPSGAVSLPFLLGRRVTLWLLPMTGTTTATDPQLVFDGRVGPGVALRGAGWAIPLMHAVKSLEAKFRKVNVTLAGFRHGNNVRASSIAQAPTELHEPLAVRWGSANMALNGDDGDGWSPDAELFIQRWNSAVAADLPGSPFQLRATLLPDRRLSVFANEAGDENLTVCADWLTPARQYSPGETDTAHPVRFTSSAPFPSAFVALSGTVRLSASDVASLPADPSLSGDATTYGVRAWWTLRAQINGGERVAKMNSASSTTVSLAPAYSYTGPFDLRALQPTTATLGLWAEGTTWYHTLRYGLLPAIDGFQGTDFLTDCIAWDRVQQIVSQAASPLDAARRYDLDLEDGLLGLIKNECALSGLVLCTYRGRLSVARIHEVSPTEPLAAALTRSDFRVGESISLSEVHDGLATAWTLTLPDKRVVQIIDEAAEAEVGKGAEIKADGSSIANPGRLLLESGAVDALTQQAMAVLGPFSRPYQMATIPLTLKHAGLQVGDVVTLDEWLLPDGYGARGLAAVPCQIMGVSRGLGTGAVDIDVLISRPDLSGYAPEVLISAIAGPTLTVDTTALGATQGPRGFCDMLMADGSARTDGGASTFTVGDKVVMLELDNATPATPESFEVVSVSGTSIVLDGSPSAAFTAIVGAGNFKVMLAFADAATATTAQRKYCYIADGSTLLINAADPARRYAN